MYVARGFSMQYRPLGRTGWNVSTISFGAWAIGGAWGTIDDQSSLAALERAIDLGVNFIDTADVYGDGRSERLVAELIRRRKEAIHVATKAGRRLLAQTADGYNRENLTTFVDRSLKNLTTETIDLLQLHCPPNEVYYRPEVFGILDDLVVVGKLRYYGVSVTSPEEGLKAMDYPNLQSVQIIFNMFRHRPAEVFLNAAKRRQVGVLARVPLASGMLTGKMRRDTQFEATDHREFNRHGEKFDRGETFSGVDYETGLQAVEELKEACPPGWSLTQFALRWILMHDGVTCAIPGAKRPEQAEDNCAAADLPALSGEAMISVRRIYDERIREQVHARW
ncbi:MAG TPA: aldo/keto reductase [Lacipirellulaceae bacterium]|nr:aldo/keto reductase [Lacipirellulaceae bacterium]